MVDRYRDRDFDDRWRDPRDRSREPYRSEYDDPRGRDFGWRGTELESGFAGSYGYDHSHDRVPAERDRDDRDTRFREREPGGDYWDDYPWSRYRGR